MASWGRTVDDWASGEPAERPYTFDIIPGLGAGTVLRGRWYEETLEPIGPDARVVARFGNGAPAAVLSKHGRGQTLLLGSYVSAAHQSSPTPEAERFFAGLLAWAGVTPSLTVSRAEIEARALESGDDTLLFLFNHGTQRAEARVSLGLPERARSAVDLVSGRMVALGRTAAGGELIVALDPKAVQVVRIGSREHVIAPAR